MTKRKIQIGKILLYGVIVIIFVIFFCYWMAFYFSRNIEQMEVNNLRVFTEKADKLLFTENIYLRPDTAYFYKLQSLMMTGEIDDKFIADRNFSGLLADNQKRAVQVDSNIHTVYSALDEETKYVLVNGGLRETNQLRDIEWLEQARTMESDCYLNWRKINTSFLNQVNLISLYRSYDSVDYNTGEVIRGYIVVNYYQNHLLSDLMALAADEENLILYNSATGEILSMRETSLSEQWMKEQITKCLNVGKKQSGLIKGEEGTLLFHFDKSAHTDLYYLTLKSDTQVSTFMMKLFLIFVLIALVLSAVIIITMIAYYMQKTKYLDGLVQIISATASDSTMEENMLQMLSEDFKSREMDVAIIAKKILEDNMDIQELRSAVISEQQLRTEIEMLYGYSQINSHFLLNTLDTIYWKSVANNGMENEETMMVERLCIILKYALDSSNPYISLNEEIECAKDYIAIQMIRKKQLLEVVWNIPENLGNAKVSKLMLQPVLENAIQHGWSNKGAPLQILVAAKMENDNLLIYVSDNGAGMPENECMRMNSLFREDQPVKSKHIGMRNVNRRIQLQYGKEYGIELQQNSNGTGLTVVMKLKYIEMQTEGGME